MPSLQKWIETRVQKSVISTTPVKDLLARHDLRDHLSNASDVLLERYQKFGELWLNVCCVHTLFLEPVGQRPVGHFSAVRDAVICRDTLALVMKRADVDLKSINPRVMMEALHIFVGALFRRTDFPTLLNWFRDVFLPIIAAADSAYLTWPGHDNLKAVSTVPSSEAAGSSSKPIQADGVKRFGQARAVLTGIAPPRATDPHPMKQAPSQLDVIIPIPSVQDEDDLPTLSGTVHKAMSAVAAVVKHELDAFAEAAFPTGILALAAQVPAAFATGFLSAIRPEVPRHRKRKYVEPRDCEQENASTTPDPYDAPPPPRKKCSPGYIRARAPSPPSPHRYKRHNSTPTTSMIGPAIYNYPKRPLFPVPFSLEQIRQLSAAMHPCVNIPETRDVIFGFLEQLPSDISWDTPTEREKRREPHLTVVARTCKEFTKPALNHLWRSTTLARLLAQCMPLDLCALDSQRGKMILLRPIYASDWNRLRLHAPRVKHLIRDPLTSLGLHEIFPALSMAFTCLLPNLQSLHWNPPNEVDFQYIHLFLPPTLTKINFVIPLTYSASSLLSTLTQRCPELDDTSIGAKYPAGLVQWKSSDWRTVSCFVLGIQHIRALSVECLQQDALEHLAELTTLKSLHLKGPLDLTVSQPPKTLPFPALRELKISCNRPNRIGVVLQLLQMFENLPLRAFDIAFNRFNAAELRSILEAVSLRVCHRSLGRFTIMFETDCPAEMDPALHLVPPDTVRLLLYFESLTCLSLTTGLGFDLDDDTILQMARAWPLIEILEMSTKIHGHPPRATSACLLAFARHCPHLSSLSMVFDATTIRAFNPETHVQQKRLHYLDVQHSPIANALDMAQILSRVFPNLQELETAYSWMEHFDDMELPVHDQRWKEVQTVLPHFLKVREEERILLVARLSG
ncbi:hypothetical protein DFH06DRAFT_1409773 [Mycena polygramma]|nr:hypothetical protein DFH06DRAFT_1409773 [Mycena polygramma]